MTEQNTLHRLTEEGQRLVSDPFLKGDAEIDPDDLAEFVEPMPGEPTADLEALDAAVDRVVSNHSRYDAAMDGALAVEVHRHLDVSRRVAGDPGLWHWLAVERYPHFVRHRWKYRSETAMREKFLGAGSDLYSNAIHRLWWIAELTYDESTQDYEVTDSVFGNQTIVNKVFDRWFARYEPAAVAVVRAVADEDSRIVDEATNQFNHALSSVQLEGLNEDEAGEMIREIVEDVK
ncbi:hypothetical protein GLW36_05795 [Halorubrum terrestre]|uniref:Uncharacterized protein n=1 Tax=Halorubrum distributum TaxID=29283 RepID=A0A6B1I5Z0_9EURY|nr:DUF6339 family protein [Halorubrum terrestre]MYL16162.1 hypothetical protein [Halorubrum terrestre]